ncbi:MAG: cysteine desulfurase [Candidatus Aenigmarchaeota archaeon]|nr:cysteine desulfurase [Candidatus Aenigmarchaeota archaeon]
MLNIDKIREDFPILRREVNGNKLIYLDNTATSQKPMQVIDAISEYYKNTNANIHRGVHTLSQEASEMYDSGRENIAEFIKCDPSELIFTRNATESLNLVAYAWGMNHLKRDDEIIITKMEHHSNMVPWHLIAKKTGAKIKAIDFGDDFSVSIESFQKLLNKKTKTVAIGHVSNVLGTINDVKKICRLAKENGSLTVVDGAQSAPHIPVNVEKMDCDFFAFSAHKMLGPTGIGGLFGKSEVLENLDPFFGGGGMIKDVWIADSTYTKPPEKFEAGTPDISGTVGFSAAIDYLRKVGMDNIEEYEIEMNKLVIDKISQLKNVNLYGPENPEKRGAIFSFDIKDMNPHDVAMLFDQEGIAVRSGQHCANALMRELGIGGTVRASPYFYNTKEEVKKFLEVLEDISLNTC